MGPSPVISPSMMALVLVLSGTLLAGLVAIVGGFLHARRSRMLAHTERMKALELGRDLPEDLGHARTAVQSGDRDENRPRSLALQFCSTTGYTCAAGFLFAYLAGSDSQGSVPAASIAIAAATGAIGVTGLICAAVLATRAPAEEPSRMVLKPRYDPEAV
jgi:hypothetical protein